MKELIAIQSELKAPKNHQTTYYHYRSAEDILEAVKPFLKTNNCILTLSDTIEQIGNRIYVKATARLVNSEGQIVETTAFAREEESNKNMNVAQITGSSSSYARKYALNGLFCIDDTEDPDATAARDRGEEIKVVQKSASQPKTKEGAMQEVTKCNSKEDLNATWKKYEKETYAKDVYDALMERKKQLGLK